MLSGNKCCSGRNREEGRPSDDVKIILDNVWGSGAGNEITAILGPSGAGKTSVLGVLAGRIGNDKKCRVTADIRLDGVSVHPAEDMTVRREIAFVEQRDTLHCAATVRESILFSAKLRLPASTTDHQLEQLTNTMIVELGLTSCSDTVIGGEMLKKGVSGGERKRAAVGVELVTKPAIVFLDEPTSGLDSFSAMQVIQVLKKVAQSGASVLFSIHQPASDIFDTFDRLILMNKGRVMYQGTGEGVTDYFAARHHPLPARYNPADWIMIVAQTVPVKELEEAGYFPKTIEEAEGDISQDEPTEQPSVEGSSALHSQQHETEEKSSSVGMKKAADGRRVSTTTQISWLVKREWKSLYRNKMILGARLMLSLFMSILIGIIFWQVGGNDSYDFVVSRNTNLLGLFRNNCHSEKR
jgi:ABC-type multidrug transport system ATPase subunit